MGRHLRKNLRSHLGPISALRREVEPLVEQRRPVGFGDRFLGPVAVAEELDAVAEQRHPTGPTIEEPGSEGCFRPAAGRLRLQLAGRLIEVGGHPGGRVEAKLRHRGPILEGQQCCFVAVELESELPGAPVVRPL